MKTILVPTDFSNAANNAADYAMELAKAMNAGIVLFHAFYVPVVAADVSMIAPSVAETQQAGTESLLRLKERLNDKHQANVPIDCCCAEGFATDEIERYAGEHAVDLIVMGMQGAGYVSETLIGSVATFVLRNIHCTAIAVNETYRFCPPKKIAFACDCRQLNSKALGPLKELASAFSSHIDILNVVPTQEQPENDPQNTLCALGFDYAFNTIDHSFHVTAGDNVAERIKHYVEDKNMDLVVVVPRKHSFLKNIFHEPNTKKIAFHSHVPVMALHAS